MKIRIFRSRIEIPTQDGKVLPLYSEGFSTEDEHGLVTFERSSDGVCVRRYGSGSGSSSQTQFEYNEHGYVEYELEPISPEAR